MSVHADDGHGRPLCGMVSGKGYDLLVSGRNVAYPADCLKCQRKLEKMGE